MPNKFYSDHNVYSGNTEFVTSLSSTNTSALTASNFRFFDYYMDVTKEPFGSQKVFMIQNGLSSTGYNDTLLYDPITNGMVNINPDSTTSSSGTAIGRFYTVSALGTNSTASSGSTTQLNTTLSLARNLKGYYVRILSGPSAGDTRQIAYNSTGENSYIKPTVAFSQEITSSSVFQLYYPVLYLSKGVASGTNTFRKYDYALDTWTSLTAPSVVSTLEGLAFCTPSFGYTGSLPLVDESTATGGTGTTIINSGKSWTVNQFTRHQVRITSGTGAGQIRTISSNTATDITVSAAWATTPDSTSKYVIEGNDDFIYYIVSTTSVLRYSISSNTWSTLTPAAARGGTWGIGSSIDWIQDSTDEVWRTENILLNGRRVYSYRGSSSNVLDYYDIPSNTWVSIPSAKTPTVFKAGASCGTVNYKGVLYSHIWDGTATGGRTGNTTFNLIKFDVAEGLQSPVKKSYVMPNTSRLSTSVGVKTQFPVVFTNGITEKVYMYFGIPFGYEIYRELLPT